jgi:diaminohydroxyphosphoribosylaminopyrimidine deaminase/5-amino-6-(5-phosphoribosylamino)uracil reductase
MERALLVAERGRGRTSPNPIVGAVVVTPDGVVVGQGAHLAAGGPHAEVVALEAAGAHARGATLYSTLEPCRHVGRTGPCVERIVAAGIRRVVIAARDPNPEAGGGAEWLRSRDIEVVTGVCERSAVLQNAAFQTWIRSHRPFVIAKTAVTADGFVGRPGERVEITGPEANRFFHRQRSEVDALAVGSGTVLADDPRLTPRESFRYRPLLRVLFDWRLRIPPSAQVFSSLSAGPVIMVVLDSAAAADTERVAALEQKGVLVERRQTTSLSEVFAWLASRQVLSVLIEGGPALQDACAAEDLIHRVQVAVAPWRLGATGGVPMAGFIRRAVGDLHEVSGHDLGDDRLIEWDVHGTDRSDWAH